MLEPKQLERLLANIDFSVNMQHLYLSAKTDISLSKPNYNYKAETRLHGSLKTQIGYYIA